MLRSEALPRRKAEIEACLSLPMCKSPEQIASHGKVDHCFRYVETFLIVPNQLRQRAIHPKVGSTTQLRGNTLKPEGRRVAQSGLFRLPVLTAQRTRKPTPMAIRAVGSRTWAKKPFLHAVSGAQSPNASASSRNIKTGTPKMAEAIHPHLPSTVSPPLYPPSLISIG